MSEIRMISREDVFEVGFHAHGHVVGSGHCEFCGNVIYNVRARWLADENGYVLECSACADLRRGL